MNKPARILWTILSVLIFVMVAGILFAPPHGLAKSDDPWIADNSVRTLSAAQMVAVGVAAGQHVAAQRATARALREQIQAATTPQELEAIVWP